MIYIKVKAEKDTNGNYVITQSAVNEALAAYNHVQQPKEETTNLDDYPYNGLPHSKHQEIEAAFASEVGTKWIARVEGADEWVPYTRKRIMVAEFGNNLQVPRKGSLSAYGSKLYGGNRCAANPYGFVYEVLALKDYRKALKRGTNASIDALIS